MAEVGKYALWILGEKTAKNSNEPRYALHIEHRDRTSDIIFQGNCREELKIFMDLNAIDYRKIVRFRDWSYREYGGIFVSQKELRFN